METWIFQQIGLSGVDFAIKQLHMKITVGVYFYQPALGVYVLCC